MKSVFFSTIARVGLVSLFLLAPLLSGCEDAYPESLRYPSRTDPIILTVPRLGKDAEPPYPDRPGQLPLRTFQQMKEPGNPLAVATANNPLDLRPEDRNQLQAALDKVYGTPAKPLIASQGAGWEEVNSTFEAARKALLLENATLAEGSKLYRIHCLHCHGLAGDGRGPTSFWINPHPRDYRSGLFKFISSAQTGARKPRRDDLLRVLRVGIDGTAMPAFNTIPADDQSKIVSYVIHLSMRGQVEMEMIKAILGNKLADEGGFDEGLKLRINVFTQQWLEAEGKQIQPQPYPYENATDEEMRKSVQRGLKFYAERQCYSCHIDFGRKASYRYDDWGTMARPADLTAGIFRGGRRPVDLYYRLHGGIDGSGMAPFREFQGPDPALKDDPKNDRLWDVINFLQAMPYPRMREKYGLMIDDPDLIKPVAAAPPK